MSFRLFSRICAEVMRYSIFLETFLKIKKSASPPSCPRAKGNGEKVEIFTVSRYNKNQDKGKTAFAGRLVWI